MVVVGENSDVQLFYSRVYTHFGMPLRWMRHSRTASTTLSSCSIPLATRLYVIYSAHMVMSRVEEYIYYTQDFYCHIQKVDKHNYVGLIRGITPYTCTFNIEQMYSPLSITYSRYSACTNIIMFGISKVLTSAYRWLTVVEEVTSSIMLCAAGNANSATGEKTPRSNLTATV